MKETIKRTDALREINRHETSDGSTNIFSIRFILKDGESVYLPNAKSAGLRANMKKNRLVGIEPCTSTGDQVAGHVYPVQIDNIMEFNGKTIKI